MRCDCDEEGIKVLMAEKNQKSEYLIEFKMFDIEKEALRKEKLKLLEVLLIIGGIIGGTGTITPTKSLMLGVFIIFSLCYYLTLTKTNVSKEKIGERGLMLFVISIALSFSILVTNTLSVPKMALTDILLLFVYLLLTFLVLVALYGEYQINSSIIKYFKDTSGKIIALFSMKTLKKLVIYSPLFILAFLVAEMYYILFIIHSVSMWLWIIFSLITVGILSFLYLQLRKLKQLATEDKNEAKNYAKNVVSGLVAATVVIIIDRGITSGFQNIPSMNYESFHSIIVTGIEKVIVFLFDAGILLSLIVLTINFGLSGLIKKKK